MPIHCEMAPQGLSIPTIDFLIPEVGAAQLGTRPAPRAIDGRCGTFKAGRIRHRSCGGGFVTGAVARAAASDCLSPLNFPKMGPFHHRVIAFGRQIIVRWCQFSICPSPGVVGARIARSEPHLPINQSVQSRPAAAVEYLDLCRLVGIGAWAIRPHSWPPTLSGPVNAIHAERSAFIHLVGNW